MYRSKRKPTLTAAVTKEQISLQPESTLADLKSSFAYYDKNNRGEISRSNLKSLMENFGWLNRPPKEIEQCIATHFGEDGHHPREFFVWADVLSLISEYWMHRGHREKEFADLFTIFDRKSKGHITASDIRTVFNEYIDIPISDEDIAEFIKEMDPGAEGGIGWDTLAKEMGYKG